MRFASIASLRKAAACALIGALSVGGSGCAALLLTTAGAVVGYAGSKDSVTIDLDRSRDAVWKACLEETKRQGRIKREDPNRLRLDAQVKEADVVITLEQLTPSTVRLVIRARKHLLPQVDVAQRLGVAIARRVE